MCLIQAGPDGRCCPLVQGYLHFPGLSVLLQAWLTMSLGSPKPRNKSGPSRQHPKCPLAYYGFYTLFTGTALFDPWLMSLFNIFFTSLFPLLVGIFEYDVSFNSAFNHPKLYYFFQSFDKPFSFVTFTQWMFTAIWQSIAYFFLAVAICHENQGVWKQNGMCDDVCVCVCVCACVCVCLGLCFVLCVA